MGGIGMSNEKKPMDLVMRLSNRIPVNFEKALEDVFEDDFYPDELMKYNGVEKYAVVDDMCVDLFYNRDLSEVKVELTTLYEPGDSVADLHYQILIHCTLRGQLSKRGFGNYQEDSKNPFPQISMVLSRDVESQDDLVSAVRAVRDSMEYLGQIKTYDIKEIMKE
jgi:hypothetical protein